MSAKGEQLRVQIQELILRIIVSGASRERMTEMLQNVHKDEAWPAILAELDELRGGGGVAIDHVRPHKSRRREVQGGSYGGFGVVLSARSRPS